MNMRNIPVMKNIVFFIDFYPPIARFEIILTEPINRIRLSSEEVSELSLPISFSKHV